LNSLALRGIFNASLEIMFFYWRLQMAINIDRRKRRGRNHVPDPRTHCVSVRLNTQELLLLNNRRGALDKGEFLRCSGLDRLPASVPEPNIDRWRVLANAGNNLNQVARQLNRSGLLSEDDAAELDEIRNALIEFRAALLGVQA
jgi:hypothetical protein